VHLKYSSKKQDRIQILLPYWNTIWPSIRDSDDMLHPLMIALRARSEELEKMNEQAIKV
jgi:hypothetical protein